MHILNNTKEGAGVDGWVKVLGDTAVIWLYLLLSPGLLINITQHSQETVNPAYSTLGESGETEPLLA